MACSASVTAIPRNQSSSAVPQANLPIRRHEDPTRPHGSQEPAHTRACTPVTPNQRLSPSQLVQAVEHLEATTSPDGGINLQTCECITSQCATRVLILPGPESPTRAANIRIRRSNYGSRLLQSPARAGYATRMRQMFEDAGHRYDEEQNNAAIQLYPQLPNISRKTAPSPARSPNRSRAAHQATTHSPSSYRPESLCLSTKLSLVVSSTGAPHASLLCPSERSSGSWSDDSGYIVTTRSRSCSATVAPDERIRTWLLEMCDYKTENSQDTDEGLQPTTNASSCQGTDPSIPEEVPVGNSGEPSPFTEDPFVGNHNETSLATLQEKRAATTFFSCRPARDTSDICKPLKLGYSKQTYATPPRQPVGTSRKHHQDTEGEKDGANENNLLEEGGIQLSPLSPNVCIERGPSRPHMPRRPLEMSQMVTPSKSDRNRGLQAPQLKENVVLKQGECAGSRSCLLTPRGNRLGTRFRRPE